MKLLQIAALLYEAGHLNKETDGMRIANIQLELTAATAMSGERSLVGETINSIVESLYVNVLESAEPERLSDLLPVFAMLCGDREPHLLFSDDLGLMDEEERRNADAYHQMLDREALDKAYHEDDGKR